MREKIALFEIILIILGTIAFAYFAAETSPYFGSTGDDESELAKKTRSFLSGWLERSKIRVVSAQEDVGLWTCLEDLNGSACQEYPSNTCNDLCNGDCFPGEREDFAECKLGTCFDSEQGTCLASTPKSTCEESGGQWTDAEQGVPAQCNPGCCLIGDGTQTQYITEATCNYVSETQGVDTEWKTVANELECLLLADEQEEGACVFQDTPEILENNCSFGTKAECSSIGGEFYKDLLCSNSELDTICQKQSTTDCIEGEDEVYWIDSCGNKENIYDSNKARSWNGGEVLSKTDSCDLESGNNRLGNQKSCGNCYYLLGSVCGTPGENDKNPIDGEFVCRDLSCTDDNGDFRNNGESWCSFDSQIGVDNENQDNDERSVDLPGSRHYRQVCLDGEVRTEACGDFRSEVCVENRDETISFSSAACRINQWQQCISANVDEIKLDNCETGTDCSLHGINVDDFEFDVCTPKYPPGFDLRAPQGGEVGEGICSLASQTCTMVEVKKLSGWKCKVNCDCDESEFTEAMNNLCISLGDCGGHVNIVGKYTDDGYRVDRAPRLDSNYISGLQKYVGTKEGQFVEPLTGKELAALFGVPESTFENSGEFGEFLGKFGLGATGVLFTIGVAASGGLSLTGLGAGGILNGIFGSIGTGSTTIFSSPGLQGFANGFAGATVGASIGFLVGKAFNLQGDALNLVVIAGAVSGAIFGSALAPNLTFELLFTQFLVPVLIVIIIVVIIVILIGLGKTREKEVQFTCSAWQPPTGGRDCDVCDDDPLGCSQYKCQSLGQTCEFLNEGTDAEACVNISPDDATAPIININKDAIGNGFKYSNAQANVGTEIESVGGDGCVQEFTAVQFGVSLNEPGQCKIEEIRSDSYDGMSNFFGGSNLYKEDHEALAVMPSLDSLGVPGVDPDRRGDYNLYVRCQDANGNANIKEYLVDICVSPANDVTPPIIIEFIPEKGYAAFEATEKFVQFYTNEPADCSWSLIDEDYSLMSNAALCNNKIEDVTIKGWLCSSTLPVQDEDETDYYFRCADKPWVADDDDDENDDDRNVNAESTIYTIKKSLTELEIISIRPQDETVTAAGVPVSVDLELTTAGGVDGSAFCAFSFIGEEPFLDFFETGSNTHSQRFTSLFDGSYDISLMCTDIAENVAAGNSVFNIEVDDEGPLITAAYNIGGTLNVITNEESQCAFDFDSCSFNFDDGEPMSGFGLEHTTSFEQGLSYNIKCQDDLENTGNCLTFIVGY